MKTSEKEKLNYLAQNFNPFQGEVNKTCLELLRELELEDMLEHPFELTNEILRRLHKEEPPTLQ